MDNVYPYDIVVEDLIEILCGDAPCFIPLMYGPFRRSIANPNSYMHYSNQVIVNYFDRNALNSMKKQAKEHDGCYTASQRKLVIKLIHKYRRQLNEKYYLPNIHEYLNNPTWLFKEREHSKAPCTVTFEDDYFYLSFPYDKKILRLFQELYARYIFPGVNKWTPEKIAWKVSNTTAGKELIHKTIETVNLPFVIEPAVEEKLNSSNIEIPQGKISMLNNELTIKSAISNRQSEMAEEIIQGKNLYCENIYQKLSWLCYLNFTFDNSVTEYLQGELKLKEWQIEIITSRRVNLNYKTITSNKLYDFIKSLNLGLTLEYYSGNSRQKFYETHWGSTYLGDLQKTYGSYEARESIEDSIIIPKSNSSIPPAVRVRTISGRFTRKLSRINMSNFLEQNKYKQSVFSSNFIPSVKNTFIPLLICKTNTFNLNNIYADDYQKLGKFIKIISLHNKNEKNNS